MTLTSFVRFVKPVTIRLKCRIQVKYFLLHLTGVEQQKVEFGVKKKMSAVGSVTSDEPAISPDICLFIRAALTKRLMKLTAM